MHGRGIASLLLEHLVWQARQRDLRAFTAETLAENSAMLRVFADAGLPAKRRIAEGVVELTFPLPVGDDNYRLGQYLEAVVSRESQNGVDRPAGRGPDAGGHALAVQHGDRPDRPQVVLVGLARGGDHLHPPGHRHLHGDRTHAARATVDEERVTGLDAEQAKTAFTSLTGHAGRSCHRPVDGRRLGRPGVQHGVLGLSALAAAEHVITHGDPRDPLADLVHHAGGIVAEIPRTGQGLATGHDPGQQFPVGRVHAGRPHRDPAARLFGATDEEINEAALMAKYTMGWSTYLNASQYDYDRFTGEVDQITAYITKQAAAPA